MTRHRRPGPVQPWRAPGFAILVMIGVLIGMALRGGG